MRTTPDEILMAFVDGELDESARRSVEASLAVDPHLRQRAEIFRLTRQPIAQVYARSLQEPVPERFLQLIAQTTKPAPRSQSLVQSSQRQRRGWSVKDMLAGVFPEPRWVPAVSGALVMAIGVGFGAGWLLVKAPVGFNQTKDQHPMVALGPQGIAVGGELGRALESLPSGNEVVLSDPGLENAKFRPVFSFRSVRDGYCRQYDLVHNATSAYAGLACRSADGVWHVRLHAATVERPPYRQGEVRLSARNEATDAVVDRMIAGNVLPSYEERALLQNGWTSGK